MIIELNLEEFDGNTQSIKCKGLMITRNKKNYFITSHSYLPISNVVSDKLKIAINCNWNELLVLKLKDDDGKYNVKISNKLPTLGSTVSYQNINATVREICFFNFGFLPNYPKTIYIKLKVEETNSIYPGTPFYDNMSRLIGITSFTEDNHIFLLPSYYIDKTFKKKNKFEISNINNTVLKINKNIVKKDMIYNPYIGFNIPLSTYMVLESNRDLEYELQGKYNKIIHKNPQLVEYKDKTLIPHKRKFYKKRDCYLINSALLHYIRLTNPDKAKIIMEELETIKNIRSSKLLVNNEGDILKV